MRLLALLLLMAAVMDLRAARIQDARPLMGTVVEVIAEGPAEPALRAAAEGAFREMQRLTDMMSDYDPASVVSAINEAAGVRWVSVPPELAEVLAQARRVAERTGGAFDITVGALPRWTEGRPPRAEELSRVDYRKLRSDARRAFLPERGMKIDLGGIAKLYILEAGRRVLQARGATRALVNGGGDVVAHSAGDPWRIGVRDPRAPKALLGTVALAAGAVASSGDYEKPGHIVDPRTGHSAQGVRGVTLVGPSAEAVNGLGPAIMVLGAAQGRRLVAEIPGVDALIVDRAGELWLSPGMARRLRPQ